MHKILLSLISIFLFHSAFAIEPNRDIKKNESTTSQSSNGSNESSKSIDQNLKNFDQAMFSENEKGTRAGKRTDGVIILHNDKVIYEKYARGYGPEKLHILWSVSKTVMALLYGVALNDKLISLDQSICEFDGTIESRMCKIRLRDVLSFTTAINWVEEYEAAPQPTQASVLAMLFGQGRKDMAQFVLSLPLVREFDPGSIWRYSSGDTILAAYMLKKIFKTNDLRQVFRERLFEPMAITNWLCEEDGEGTLAAAYYFYLSAPDLIKVGQLLKDGGVFNGKRLLPTDFIDYMKQTPRAFKENRHDLKGNFISGSSLWVNDNSGLDMSKPWPEAPADTFAGMGHWGQYLVVIPSLQIVAVRVGDTRDRSFLISDFVRSIMTAFGNGQSGGPSIEDPLRIPPPKKNLASIFSFFSKGDPDKPTFDTGVLHLGLAFTAKAFCSCLFVSKLPEAECKAYASLEQVSPKLKFSREEKTTTSSFLFFFERKAQFLGEGRGCTLM